MTTYEGVRGILTEWVDDDVNKPELRLRWALDSLELSELMLELENFFEIEIPDDEVQKIHTVGDIVSYIEKAKAVIV